MPATNFPNGVSSWGVPQLGMGPFMPMGKVLFVQSSHSRASNGNSGEDRAAPLATIQRAVDLCSANAGDVVIVGPGHVETVSAAAGLVLNKAGVSFLGIGNGALRPTINFTTVIGADMDIDAENITITNFLFTGSVDNLTAPIDINAADVRLLEFETRDVVGQVGAFIHTDANCNRLLVSGWRHIGDSVSGTSRAILVIGGSDIIIENFEIYGNFIGAAIQNGTSTTSRIRIGGGNRQNYIWTENSGDVAIAMLAGTTGSIGPNINIMLQDNAANITEAVDAAGCQMFQPINIVNLAGESSMQTNITASTDA